MSTCQSSMSTHRHTIAVLPQPHMSIHISTRASTHVCTQTRYRRPPAATDVRSPGPPTHRSVPHLCARVSTRVHTHVCTHVHTHVCAHACACLYTCPYTCLFTCPYILRYTCPYTCLYACTHRHVPRQKYICTHGMFRAKNDRGMIRGVGRLAGHPEPPGQCCRRSKG